MRSALLFTGSKDCPQESSKLISGWTSPFLVHRQCHAFVQCGAFYHLCLFRHAGPYTGCGTGTRKVSMQAVPVLVCSVSVCLTPAKKSPATARSQLEAAYDIVMYRCCPLLGRSRARFPRGSDQQPCTSWCSALALCFSLVPSILLVGARCDKELFPCCEWPSCLTAASQQYGQVWCAVRKLWGRAGLRGGLPTPQQHLSSICRNGVCCV